MSELIDRYGWVHMETQSLASQPHSLLEQMRNRCGAPPDVVLFLEYSYLISSAFLQLFHSSFRVAIFSHDLHWFHAGMQATKMLALAVADVILAPYAPVFERFFPEVAAAKRVVWVPHAASP